MDDDAGNADTNTKDETSSKDDGSNETSDDVGQEKQEEVEDDVGQEKQDEVEDDDDVQEDDDAMDIAKELEEARGKIIVLEKKLKREETLRESVEKHNADLRQQVEKLSQELHERRQAASGKETQDVGVQTEPECIHIQDEQPPNQAEVIQVNDSTSSRSSAHSSKGPSDWTTRTPGQIISGQSIAESVRATAEAALTNSGIVLDEASGMYYDYNSGYYYDPNNHLYYDPSRGIYYYYDEASRSYQVHSRVELPEVLITSTSAGNGNQLDDRRLRRERRRGERERGRSRRNREQSRDECVTVDQDRPSTSTMDMDYEVIDITSPTKELPENGVIASSTQNNCDEADNNDVVEIIDEDDSNKRRRRRSKSSGRNPTKAANKEGNKGDGDDLPDVILIDSDDSDMEEGELSDSSSYSQISSGESSGEEEGDGSEESEESMIIDADGDGAVEAPKVDYPPCIRMIVVRSDSMKLGSLAIVTCKGGSVGREGSNHILLVPELGVSKTHAQISYNSEKKIYTITDLGSQNGTVLNGIPLTQKSRMKSEPQLLGHKDYLTFGTTTLRIHIHRGDETCDECEPGQVQAMFRQAQVVEGTASTVSKVDKEQQRRKELRRMKKKYHVAGGDRSQVDPSKANLAYKDRADERRATVGSDNPYQVDDLPASVNRAISDNNMGHKMLKKMGWKEGESLGKSDAGIKEPIQVFFQNKKAGLGAGGQKTIGNMQALGQRNSERWERARDRFQALEQGANSSAKSSGPPPLKWVQGVTWKSDTSSTNQVEPGNERQDEMELSKDAELCVDPIESDPTKKESTQTNSDEKESSSAQKEDAPKPESSAQHDELTNSVAMDDASDKAPSLAQDNAQASAAASPQNNSTPAGGSSETLNNETSHGEAPKSGEITRETTTAPQKPIKFVIPPKKGLKEVRSKSPLDVAGVSSTPEKNGEKSTSGRRTRQSNKRTSGRKDQVDMFENG